MRVFNRSQGWWIKVSSVYGPTHLWTTCECHVKIIYALKHCFYIWLDAWLWIERATFIDFYSVILFCAENHSWDTNSFQACQVREVAAIIYRWNQQASDKFWRLCCCIFVGWIFKASDYFSEILLEDETYDNQVEVVLEKVCMFSK